MYRMKFINNERMGLKVFYSVEVWERERMITELWKARKRTGQEQPERFYMVLMVGDL